MIRFSPRHLAATVALVLAILTLVAGALAAPPPPGETPGARALLTSEDPGLPSIIPNLGAQAAGGLAGKPIRRIEVVTVGGRWPVATTIHRVLPGERASAAAARRAMREVLAEGHVARANVEAFEDGWGVVLRVNVLSRRIVAAIKVEGGALDQAETLEAAGVALRREITAPHLDAVPARVQKFYADHGYPAARVRADAADTDDADEVVVSIYVTPGAPRTVKRRVFVIDPVADAEVGDLKKAYRVGAGTRVDEPALAEADRDLVDSLRQKGFVRARVVHGLQTARGHTYLYVYITPGPRLVPAFDGQRAFDASDLEQAVNLEKSPTDRPTELVERVRTFYASRGFLDAEVSMVEKGKPEEPVHYLAFTIREHRQVRVTKRVFPCLKVQGEITANRVGDEIGSFLEEDLPGAERFWPPDPRLVTSLFGPKRGSGGRGAPADLNPLVTYSSETYERSLKHLKDLFHSLGYLNAVVGPVSVIRATCAKRSRAGECIPLPPKEPIRARCLKDSLGLPVPEPSVPESLSCTPDPRRGIECSPEMTIRIPIALGPQTTTWDLAFEGNKSLTGAALGKIAALPLGTPLSSVELEAARVRVLDAYRRGGYAYAEVRTNAEPSPDRTRARIRFYVTEREKVIVTGFVVKGAARTNERLILRRVALRVNEPYRLDDVRATEERIATLGTFSSVSVGLEDSEVPGQAKRVVITVVENPSLYLEARPGFSTGDGVRGSFEWGHRNLGGLAISVSLRIQLSYLFDFLILDPQVLANYTRKCQPGNTQCVEVDTLSRLERRNNVSFSFPEIGLGPLIRLSLDAIDLHDNQRDYSITKEAIVPTLTYRPARQLSAQLGFSAEYNDVTILNQDALASTKSLLRAPEGKTVALAQLLAATADYRDKPLDATRGVLVSGSVEHVNAFPTGEFDPKDTAKSHFLRFSGRIAGYIRLTRGGIALAASLGLGYNLQLFQGSKTYPDRLFFLGGGDSMRAFLAGAMVPEDLAQPLLQLKDPIKQQEALKDIALRGGDAAINPRLELRVPVFDIWSAGFFIDTGNVWLDPSRISATLRYAAGAGVRIGTPIGPIALDYGVNLLRRPWEDFGAFHFSIGLF